MSTTQKQVNNFLKKHRPEFMDYITNSDSFEFLEWIGATEKHGHKTTKEEFEKIKNDKKINVSSVINLTVYAEFQMDYLNKNECIPSKIKKTTGKYPLKIELKMNELIKEIWEDINKYTHYLPLEPFEIYNNEGVSIINHNVLNSYSYLVKNIDESEYIKENIKKYYLDNKSDYPEELKKVEFIEGVCNICLDENKKITNEKGEEIITQEKICHKCEDITNENICQCKFNLCNICAKEQIKINKNCLICHTHNKLKDIIPDNETGITRKQFRTRLIKHFRNKFNEFYDFKNMSDGLDSTEESTKADLLDKFENVEEVEIRYVEIYYNYTDEQETFKKYRNILLYNVSKLIDDDELITNYLIEYWLDYGFNNYTFYEEFIKAGYKHKYKMYSRSQQPNINDVGGIEIDDEDREEIRNDYLNEIDWEHLVPYFRTYLKEDYENALTQYFENEGYNIIRVDGDYNNYYIYRGNNTLFDRNMELENICDTLFNEY